MLASKNVARIPTCKPRTRLVVRAFGPGNPNHEAFTEGQKVKVIKSVKLFSVPKHPEGVEIEGMEGVVAKNCALFKGKVLSPNFPFVVKFETTINGTPAKFQAHMVRGMGICGNMVLPY